MDEVELKERAGFWSIKGYDNKKPGKLPRR